MFHDQRFLVIGEGPEVAEVQEKMSRLYPRFVPVSRKGALSLPTVEPDL
jgi:hypothetical protein